MISKRRVILGLTAGIAALGIAAGPAFSSSAGADSSIGAAGSSAPAQIDTAVTIMAPAPTTTVEAPAGSVSVGVTVDLTPENAAATAAAHKAAAHRPTTTTQAPVEIGTACVIVKDGPTTGC